jgi:ubiquinone/menaquinone biosynthesis C-methylase UbiE
MSDLGQFQHPRFARMYERISAESERRGTAACRDRTLAGLAGRVIEVGAGNGMNFSHYPPGVAEVVAVEPEDQLRALAEKAAASSGVPVRVVPGHAGALPFGDASFVAAVASLVLCSVPDMRASLAELRRVLKPGGELRFLEHVRSASRLAGAVQDVLTPLWACAGGGCHLNRDTAAAIMAAGFGIEELDRFSYRPLRFVPAHAHILGTARKPESTA